MSAVQNLIAELIAAGIDAEWHNTGGGCFAIRLPFGVSESHPFGTAEILVTDKEDVFYGADYAEDEGISGFFARAYRLDAEGVNIDDDDAEGVLYATRDEAGLPAYMADEGEPLVDLSSELDELFAAILNAVDAGKVGSIELPRRA